MRQQAFVFPNCGSTEGLRSNAATIRDKIVVAAAILRAGKKRGLCIFPSPLRVHFESATSGDPEPSLFVPTAKSNQQRQL